MKRIFTSIAFVLLLVFLSVQTFAQISGVVYRDFNANGSRQTTSPNFEPGAGGITVNAYNASNGLVSTTTSANDGTYTMPFTVPVRVEFTLPTSGNCVNDAMENTGFGNDGNNIRFVTASTSTLNYGILNPNDYTPSVNPMVYVPVQYAGNPLGGGSSGAQVGFRGFEYNSNGSILSPKTVTQASVGSLWGVAYSKQAKKIFTSAFLKRQVGLGPMGSGGIYMLEPTASSFNVTQFYDMDANGYRTRAASTALAYGQGSSYTVDANGFAITYNGPIDLESGFPEGLGVIGTNTERTLPAAMNADSYDPAAFDQVGKVGIGDIDISDDGKFLFVMNLYSRKVYRLELNDAYNPTSVISVTSYSVPSVAVTDGQLRPFAVQYHRGKLYAGAVATGENGGTNIVDGATDLYAHIFEMSDPTGAATFNATPILSYPLNYQKGYAVTTLNTAANNKWFPWTNNSNSGFIDGFGETIYPSPVLSNIEFTDRGDMIMNFFDRMGHQQGYFNYKNLSTTTATTMNDVGGDVLIAGRDCGNGNFVLENNGSYNSNGTVYTGNATNNEGPGSGEFFYQEYAPDQYHHETSQGACAMVPGSKGGIFTLMDPIASFQGGVGRFFTDNGTSSNRTVLYGGTDGEMAKANGLGDIEYASVEPPIEIGNRVWIDANANGIQDPTEVGIANVTIELYCDVDNNGEADGASIASVNTNGQGYWYFNESNVIDGDCTTPGNQPGLLTNAHYVVGIGGSDWTGGAGVGNLNGFLLTLTNITGNGIVDASDNDGALVLGTPQIPVSTTKLGANNHTYDFGFVNCFANAGADMVACGGTCVTVAGTGPTTGTWSAQSGNPFGATLGTTTGGIATICFNNVASGTFNFIYNTASGCEDTMSVVVDPKPNAGTDMTACGLTCLNLVGTSPINGTWTAQSGNPSGATLGTSTGGIAEVCFTATASGTYNFIYTTAGGCSDTMNVVVSPKPDAGSDMTACGATCTDLVGNSPANGTWSAQSGNPTGATLGATTAGTAEVCFTATASGTYNFIYTTAGGCSDTMNVVVNPKPNAGNDMMACGATCANLVGTAPTTGTWSAQSGNPSGATLGTTTAGTAEVCFTATASGTYNFIYTTGGGCSDTMSVEVNPKPEAGNDMTACGATCTNLVGNAPANGTWTAMSGNPTGATLGTTTAGTAEVCFTAPSNGTYTFMYTTAGGCSDTMSVEVTAKPIAGPDQTTCFMNGAATITLAGSGVGTWSEQAGNPGTSTITSTSNPTTTVTNFSTPGTYNYIWMNNTCTDTVSVIITPNGNVGNYVWNDHNNNGLNDEPSTDGINNITVELWKETTPGSGTYTLNQTTTTANDGSSNPGYYNFMICETANYQVKFPTTTNSLVLTTQNPTAGTDDNSDATIATGISPTFNIDVNGSGVAKNNPTIDAGYHLATPTLKSFPNNTYCFGQNIVLKAEGVAGATFNWTTPSGFTGTIDNSVSGVSTITILNLSSADNGLYSVTQSFGTNTSAAANNTIDGGAKPSINFLTTACVAGMGEITVNASPSTGLEFAVNDGPYQTSNVLSTTGGSVFVVSVKTTGSSCELFYSGEIANCNTSGTCTSPATDSVVTPTLACVGTPINVASYFTNAASGTWTSTGSGTFSATFVTSSPSFVTYTPSAADFAKGHVIVTFTTSDPDGAGPCGPAICSKNIILVCGLVAPIATNNGPVCAGSPLTLEANGAVGTIGWNGPSGYTSTGDSVTIATPTLASNGLYTATATGYGCTSSPSASYASTTATILSAPNLTVTAVGNAELCQGAGNGSIDVTIAGGSGNYTTCYNSTLSNCSNGTPAHFSYVAPGNYTVTVVDANCPNNTMSYPVVVNGGVSVPTPVVASTINICEGDALVLVGSIVGPGVNINWTKGPGFNAIGNPVTILNATPSMSGEYYAKALNIDGCASAQVATIVTVAAKPIITHVQVNCIGTSAEMTISATVSGTATLTYSLDGINYQSSNQYSGVAPGNYTLHVKESLSNCETTLPLSVINCACPTAPVVNIAAPIHSCGLTAVPVTGTFTNVSNATWSATGTGNFSVSSGASPLTTNYTPSAADLALGHVYLIMTTDDPDGTGPCTPVSQSVYVILLDSLQTPVITTLEPTYCAGDTVVMVANNVNSYVHWTGVGGYVSDSTSAVLNNATQFLSGFYTATVSGNGCVTKSATFLLDVSAPPTLTVTPSSTPEGCEGQGNGAIQATVTGGSGIYNICYVLNSNCYTGASPADFKWLSPGTYTIYVADSTCKNSYSTSTVTVAPGMSVTPPTGASYNAPVCEGSDLVLTATGIAGTYLWTEGSNNFTATGNPITRTDAQVGMSGTYKVQRVESGCASTPVYLDVHVSGMPEIISAIPECRTSGEDSGKITVNTIINGGDPIEYSLNGGTFQTSNVFDYLTNGLYQITARTIGTNCEVTMNGVELYCLCNCGKDALINVFPNPSTGTFSITGSLEVASSDVSIAVYNFLGQTIYSKTLEGETTIFNEPIDIRAYAAGSYMVKVVIDGQSYIRPITITDKQ